MVSLRKIRSHDAYKWVVVGCCFLMIMVCLGFCSSTKGMYLSAITQALDMDRSSFSINDSVRYVATALVNLFFGALVLRFGPRKLIAGGFLCLMASMLVCSVAETLPMFYLGGALLGIGQSWTSTSIVGYVVGLWCRENKGTIMGAVLAANGIGGAVSAQIVGPFINGSVFGFRDAYRIVTVILLVTGLLVVLLFKDRPENPTVAATTAKKTKVKGWYGLTLRQCLRKPHFYVMAAYVFIMGLVIQTASAIFPSHMTDVGLDADFVTTVVSVYSLGIAACKFLAGVLYDRAGLRVTLLLCGLGATVSSLILAVLQGDSQVMAMVYAIVFAIGVPVQTVGMPLITVEYFGHRDEAAILGVLVSISTVGYAVGTPLVNLFYDVQGTYVYALLLMAAMMAVATVASMLAMNTADRLKKEENQQGDV